MSDMRQQQLEMFQRTFPIGSTVYECGGTVSWTVWAVVSCNGRPSVVMVRTYDGQLRAVWADNLSRRINQDKSHWTLEAKTEAAD
jgi:hypothetical protein